MQRWLVSRPTTDENRDKCEICHKEYHVTRKWKFQIGRICCGCETEEERECCVKFVAYLACVSFLAYTLVYFYNHSVSTLTDVICYFLLVSCFSLCTCGLLLAWIIARCVIESWEFVTPPEGTPLSQIKYGHHQWVDGLFDDRDDDEENVSVILARNRMSPPGSMTNFEAQQRNQDVSIAQLDGQSAQRNRFGSIDLMPVPQAVTDPNASAAQLMNTSQMA